MSGHVHIDLWNGQELPINISIHLIWDIPGHEGYKLKTRFLKNGPARGARLTSVTLRTEQFSAILVGILLRFG